jgi:hypothetical protein
LQKNTALFELIRSCRDIISFNGSKVSKPYLNKIDENYFEYKHILATFFYNLCAVDVRKIVMAKITVMNIVKSASCQQLNLVESKV